MSISGRFGFLALVSSLAWLWFILINHLRVEWTLNPQYNYGWAVPVLCLYLAWKNTERLNSEKMKGENVANHFSVSAFQFFSFCLLAFLYFPTRLVEQANPEWRLVSWALALEVIGITLYVLWWMQCKSIFRSEPHLQNARSNPSAAFGVLVFPLCFFFIAVPWPTLVEGPLVQWLTRVVSGITVELVGFFGIPAIRHGNVIELTTGLLGIDEACSGIRSLQATLMISLFLGELYALAIGRRVLLVVLGFALAFSFNVLRAFVLTLVAAQKGILAVAFWHDPAGVTIVVGCFLSLWLVGLRLAKKKTEKSLPANLSEISDHSTPAAGFRNSPVADSAFTLPIHRFRFLGLTLLIWLVAVELSVEWWYRSHETRLSAAQQWTVAWPTNNPSFRELIIPARTRQILRYDEGRDASWTDDARNWQGIFLRWNPGRIALYLARNHTPEICLPAAGRTLISSSDQQWLDVHGLHLPFRAYELLEGDQTLRVYYCLWDDRSSGQGFESMGLNYRSRLQLVLAGQRNAGQRSLEIAVRGITDGNEAKIAFHREMERLIHLDN